VTGWSAGTEGIAYVGDVADVMIAMAGLASSGGTRVKSTLLLAAQDDKAFPYSMATKLSSRN